MTTGDSHRSEVKRPSPSDPDDLIYGRHAVEEALERGDALQVLLDAAAGSGGREIADSARQKGVDVRVLPPEAFASLARGRPFQGVAARVKPFDYADPDDLIAAVATDPAAVCVALDQVMDPQNVGSILRTSAFYGVRGVFIPKDRAAPVTPGVVRASAGAAGHVRVALVTNLARTLTACKEAGFTTVGAVARGGVTPDEVPRRGPFLLVMGSEAEGLRRLVRETCDVLVTLPSPGGFESLNVGVATGILVNHLVTRRA